MNRVAAAAALTALLGLAMPPPVEAAAANLLSHRAAYRLSLARVKGVTSTVSGVTGGLVVEWQAACDGYISTQRLGFTATTDEGQGFSYDVRFSSWESRDDRSMRFNVRTFEGGKLHEEFRGDATLGALDGKADKKGVATFTTPPDHDLPLPAGTLFPTAHIRDLIASAEAGRTFVSRTVFDGSGDEALSTVSAVIGQARPAAATDEPVSWPISLAYHSLVKPKDLPEFELTFQLRGDGVMDSVRLDYGDFTLDGTLEKFEALPPAKCN